MPQSGPRSIHAALSPHEAELTRLIARGLDTDDMAAAIGLSVCDLEQRLVALEAKLGTTAKPQRRTS